VFKVKGGYWVTVEMAAGMCLGSRVGVGCACWFELVVLGGVWVMGVSPGSVRVALEGLLSRWVCVGYTCGGFGGIRVSRRCR
jgi:hypothetical protein